MRGWYLHTDKKSFATSLVSTVGHKNTAHVFSDINVPTFYCISGQITTDIQMTLQVDMLMNEGLFQNMRAYTIHRICSMNRSNLIPDYLLYLIS